MTNQPSASSESGLPWRRRARWILLGVLTLVILASAVRLAFFDVWERDDWLPPPWDGRPRFMETRHAKYSVPAKATVRERLEIAYRNLRQQYTPKNPAGYSLPATTNQLWGIHGMLSQCMEIGGTKYLIAQEASITVFSTVLFGYTNTLNGAQWIAAVESALQTNQVQCFHPSSNGMWGENLLLIREKPGLVKVVPPSRLADYQKAGLVDRSYRAER